MSNNITDCRTENGKTVGIIDTIINCAHILIERKLDNKEVQEALTDLYRDPELLKIMNGDIFVGRHKPKEIEYKEETILTDGNGFIRIGYLFRKDWSPSNNYGRKRTDYWNCTHYPKSENNEYYLNGEMIYSGKPGDLPGLWLQEGYSLGNFRPINKKLIHPDILKCLEK